MKLINNHKHKILTAVIGAIALTGCSSSGSVDVSEIVTVSTPEVGLATNVIDGVSKDKEITVFGTQIPLQVGLNGAEGQPTVSFDAEGSATTLEVDGQTYTIINDEEGEPEQGTAFATELAVSGVEDGNGPNGFSGVGLLGYGDAFGDTANGTEPDVDGFAVVFVGTPTDPSNLPTSTATYSGNYNGAVQVEDDVFDRFGTFEATADFGAAQSVTGTFTSDDGSGTAGTMTAEIQDNGFSGVVKTQSDSGDLNFDTGGIFVGDNAETMLGAATVNDEDIVGVITYAGTSE